MIDAIVEDRLAISNFVQLNATDRDDPLDDVEEKRVTLRHRLIERVQFQVLYQRRLVPLGLAVHTEVAVPIEQICLHSPSRSFRWS